MESENVEQKGLRRMRDPDDKYASQMQRMKRWFAVFLVAVIGVVGLGIWAIVEGRTTAGIGYFAVAVVITILVGSLQAVGRRRL